MASLISHPPLLAHTIYQALVFDAAMREQEFQLEGTTSEEQSGTGTDAKSWSGISDVILGNQEWFEAWLAGEKKFAEDQYHAIISAPEAWTIDDDAEEESQDFQPTTSARRLKALIEQITGMLDACCIYGVALNLNYRSLFPAARRSATSSFLDDGTINDTGYIS